MKSLIFIMLACAPSAGCVPVQLAERDFVGAWSVEGKCGTERLELGAIPRIPSTSTTPEAEHKRTVALGP